MGFYAFLAIGIGAASGAWLRWGLGILLNPVFPTLPLGTLAANLLGGFLMGMAMHFLTRTRHPCPGNSPGHHHRLFGRSHYLFHLLGGNCHLAAA